MKIAICVKAVPDTETKIKIAANNLNIDFTGVRFIMSPYDEFALEEATKLKEKYGGETTAFSVGGPESTDVLRDALARGVDNAVHLQDDSFAALDPLGTARVLTAALAGGNYDMVFCGQQGVGGDHSQVPAMLAELLDWAQATLVVKLEINNGKFCAEREIEGAHELIEGVLPAVISAQKGLNEPRYPSIKGVMAARRKEILVKNAQALGLANPIEPTVRLKAMNSPPSRVQGRIIDGDVETQVKMLVNLLRTEAQVI